MQTNRQRVYYFALVVLSNIFIILFLGSNGPMIQIDTANYYSAAYNLLKGNGFKLFDGEYLQNAPPLFSILALPCYLLNIPETIYMWFVHLLAFNSTLIVSIKLLSFFKVSNQKLAGLFVLTFGFSWLHIWEFALSEAVFLPLFLAWMYFLIKGGKRTLFYSAVAMVLLCLTRYLVWLMLPGLILPIFMVKNFCRRAIISIIPAFFVTITWLLFNYQFNQKPFGDHKLLNKISFNAVYNNLSNWLNGLVNEAFFLNVAFLIYLVLTIILIVIFYQVKPKLDKNITATVTLIFGTGITLALFLLLQPGLSLVQLPRYISVLWTPLAISIYLLIDNLKLSAKVKKIMLVTSIGVHLIAIIFLSRRGNDMLAYNTMSHLAFSEYLQNNSCMLGDNNLSNYPDLVWWLSKKQCKYTLFLNENRNAFLARIGSNRNHHLIWFESQTRFKVMRTDLGWVLKEKPCFNGQGFRISVLDTLSY